MGRASALPILNFKAMRLPKLIGFGIALGLASMLYAGNAQLKLTPDTTVSVSDNRSTVTITALLYTNKGDLVPDGTQVVFEAQGATFRESVLSTVQGRARAVLIAPGTPGTVKVTASALAYGATSTCEIEYFADRSLLSSAKEYVEVYSKNAMAYSPYAKRITASSPDQGVRLRYREIQVDADDLQFDVPSYSIKAKNAHVKMGRQEFDAIDLQLKLNARRGYAVTRYMAPTLSGVKAIGPWFQAVTEMKERLGTAEVSLSGIRAPEAMPSDAIFTFTSDEDSPTLIQAKKCIVFPRREVQFQDAELMAGGAKVMKLPLYRVSMTSAASDTYSILNVKDNKLAINYPYYVTLKPGQTSLFRFRTGESYGRGSGASNRISLDYELAWNQGDGMEGGLSFQGIARKDWGISFRQYIRFKDDTTLNANIELPSNKSLFGAVSMSKQFKGFAVSMFGSANRALRGTPFDTQTTSLTGESDPIKLGNLPLRFYYGLTASYDHSKSGLFERTNRNAGLRLRTQLTQQNLDRNTNLNASFTVTRNLAGGFQPFTYVGSATLSRQINSKASVFLTYDYLNDGFNSSLIGKHRLTLTGSYQDGRSSVNLYASRSLDLRRINYFADLAYSLGKRWGLAYSHTFSEYLNDRSLEMNPMLTYDLGQRQIGLVWSNRTKRFGIQILGGSLN